MDAPSTTSAVNQFHPASPWEATILESDQLLVKAKAALAQMEAESAYGSAHLYEHIQRKFDFLREKLQKVSRVELSARDSAKLMRRLNRDLPAWLEDYLKGVIKRGPLHTYERIFLNNRGTAIANALHEAIQSQAIKSMNQSLIESDFTRALLASSPKKELEAVKPAVKEVTKVPVLFPHFNFTSNALRGEWQQLKDAWSQAERVATHTEDRFRIDQIATDYLPESLRMYRELESAAPGPKTEAEELLRQQFASMRVQLEQVLQKHSEDALTALRAQTAFVQEVTKRPGDSGLVL